MDPITLSLLGSIALPALGGVLGNAFAGDDQERAARARQSALDAILGIKTPSIEEQKLNLEDYRSAGNLNPEMQAAIELEKSKMNDVQTDPRLKDAQMSALQRMGEIGQGGMTAMQRAELEESRRNALSAANAQSESIKQNMQARGMGGSGMELAARLAAAQNASNLMAAAGDRTQAMAQQNANEAMARYGSMAGQMQQTEFGQKADVARANDLINEFNTRNRQSISNTNVQAQNSAQQYNLGNKQNLMNANVDLRNQQQAHNKGLYQQQFNNELSKGQSAAGQYGQTSQYYGDQANATRGMWSGLGAAGGKAAGDYGRYDLLKKMYKIT